MDKLYSCQEINLGKKEGMFIIKERLKIQCSKVQAKGAYGASSKLIAESSKQI